MKPFREAAGYAGDLQAAYNYYRAYSEGAALRFPASYQSDMAVISSHPHVAHVRRHGWRQIPVRRHPRYAIFYKEVPDFWILGGIIPTARDPDVMLASLLIREVDVEE
jgi:hypothetical protein